MIFLSSWMWKTFIVQTISVIFQFFLILIPSNPTKTQKRNNEVFIYLCLCLFFSFYIYIRIKIKGEKRNPCSLILIHGRYRKKNVGYSNSPFDNSKKIPCLLYFWNYWKKKEYRKYSSYICCMELSIFRLQR